MAAATSRRNGVARVTSPRFILKLIIVNATLRIIVVLGALIGVFAGLRPAYFFTVDNLRNIVLDSSILMVIAVGMTLVIITAGIDISVGSVLVFSGVLAAKTMDAMGGTSDLALVVGLLVSLGSGLACGLVNGVLISRLRLPAFVATLGTLGVFYGFALLLCGGVDQPYKLDRLVLTVGRGTGPGGLPWLIVIALGVAALVGIILRGTQFGRFTYAVGSNPEAARRAGINVARHLTVVYGICGLLAGLAGWMSLARFNSTTIGGHSTDNLQAIAGVVIGGTSMLGGAGGIAGTVVGTLIPLVLQNGFIILAVEPFWQEVAIGTVLLVAVYFDQLRHQSGAQ
jgi:ribose transport system permease protein